MTAVWIALGCCATLIGSVALAILTEVVGEEARTRIERLPYLITRLAIRRAPHGMRDELRDEWGAELAFIARDTPGLPITRLLRSLRFTTGLVIAAGRIDAPPPVTELVGAPRRTVMAFDIVGFRARCRDEELRVVMRQSLDAIVKRAIGNAGIAWEETYREDRGDGGLIIVPAGTSPAVLIGPFVAELTSSLRQHNRLFADVVQIRLRMAVHTAPMQVGEHGVSGDGVVHLFRMLEAPALKRAMADSTTEFALAASESVLQDVTEPATTSGSYRPIEVNIKETRSSAWIHEPEHQPSGPVSRLLNRVGELVRAVCRRDHSARRRLLTREWIR